MRSPFVFALASSFSLLACTAEPVSDDAATELSDAGTPDAACACEATEFCCLGLCQPLGTACGSAPDAGHDAPIDPCSVDRPRPDGSGDAQQISLCATPGSVRDCASTTTRACPSGAPDCESWFDESTDRWAATCFEEGASPCTADDPLARCEGNTLVYCNERSGESPPYRAVEIACTYYGPDAVCVPGDGGAIARCDIPSAPACDRDTFVGDCTTDLAGTFTCGPLDRVVVSPCDAGDRCLDNTTTRAAGGVSCIPTDATPSATGPSTSPSYLRCESPTSIRVEQFGYEWTEVCERTLSFVSDGMGGYVEAWIDQACYAGTGGVRCEPVGTEHCDPATYTPSCNAEETIARSCMGDLLVETRCSTFGLDYPCDPSTGQCAPVEPCNAMFPFISRCVLGGTHHMVCHGTEGIAVAEPCAGCVEVSGGRTRCD